MADETDTAGVDAFWAAAIGGEEERLGCGCVVGKGATVHSPCRDIQQAVEKLRGLAAGAFAAGGPSLLAMRHQRETLEGIITKHVQGSRRADAAAAKREAKRLEAQAQKEAAQAQRKGVGSAHG